jgi:hypothetical protein
MLVLWITFFFLHNQRGLLNVLFEIGSNLGKYYVKERAPKGPIVGIGDSED